MKQEHYNHVTEHFNLSCTDVNLNTWHKVFTKVDIENVVVRYISGDDWWCLDQLSCPRFLFIRIPTKEFAEDVLQYIKDTEVLFI